MANNPIQYDNRLLITREDIDKECRPCNAQDALVDRCIEEAQNLDIIPAIGADWWLRVLDRNDDAVATLLWEGGIYRDTCGNAHIFAGLKKALLYYAYGRIVRSSGGVSTRFDFVVKADQYSDSADLQAKVQAYNEAFANADNYKAQCLAYLNTSETCCKRKMVNNRLSVKKIGH
jgi:hypothetical protein